MAARNITATQLQELIASKKTVLVDFWAPWCPHCRKIGQAYEQIAAEYAGRLEAVKVNMDEDDALWETLQVELIPTLRLYVDGKPADAMVAPESKAQIEAFLAGILPARQQEATKRVYDMIVVGGGPAGYTAALYAARAGMETLVVEKLSAGGQMALTHQIDNYPGFAEGIDGFALAEQMQRQAERFGAQTRNAQVRRLHLLSNPKAVETNEGVFYGKTLVLAMGANPRELGVEREKELVGRGVAYCAACDGMLYKDKTVVVVGGGNTAAADALLLSRIARKVIVVHRRDTLRATKVYHDPLMKAKRVDFQWNSVVTELLGGDKLTGVRIRHVDTGEESVLAADGIFVSIGRKPATELVAQQLVLDQNGYIPAGETTETGIPGVYAVGDIRAKPLRQVVTAVADGAVAVHQAEAFLAANAGA